MDPIDCDVLASGGGMAGTVAAIAAARQGARTVLFERHGFLAAPLRPAPSASSSAGKRVRAVG